MNNLNKDTHVFCEVFDFFGTIQELSEHIHNIGEYDNYRVVTVKIANKEPFVDVDDNFLIDMVTREIEYQSESNERSSESGDEIEKVIELIVKHTRVNYKALMDEMPELYYGTRSEITIDLDDFGKEVSSE
ncbi:hypothetical protein OHD16_06845 [Sphingobacterium sp. ML3W]|uniref:hypothetical protein n=1 Tax=Sphingobacterium sp. ML3W TaxID=1538644 RepID=UPI002499F06C|nr:hypothetical protein [Sphingobacterium sp. ML3W]WFA79687.1 hypothetical protein OGI71_27085 [Sphingobacterium sp. ML3W]